jgi:cupin domain
MSRRSKGRMVAVVVGAMAYASTVQATPPAGFTGTTIAKGLYEEIDVHNVNPPPDYWQAKLKTKGMSDLYVQSNVWQPGGSTGWHTHPGHSLITVTAGEVTAYDGDDPTCAPKVYTVGMGFVDAGGDHVHVLRNEGAVEARTITVQLIPAEAIRRIDAPDPGNCPF